MFLESKFKIDNGIYFIEIESIKDSVPFEVVYILGELIREDKYYYKNEAGGKNFYYTDEMIEYYKLKGELDSL